MLSYIPFYPDAEVFQTPASHQQVMLVEGLQSVSFDYFGSLTNARIRSRTVKQPPGWHRSWDADAQSFPDLIRVRMEVYDGQQPWPDLYLALPAERSQ